VADYQPLTSAERAAEVALAEAWIASPGDVFPEAVSQDELAGMTLRWEATVAEHARLRSRVENALARLDAEVEQLPSIFDDRQPAYGRFITEVRSALAP
jgi:hypothetical protein